MSVRPNHPARTAPALWSALSRHIRHVRAHDHCEICGIENHSYRPRAGGGDPVRVVLTAANVCDCDPPCLDENHVVALCQRDHLSWDADRLRKRRAIERGMLLDLQRPLLAAEGHGR